MELNLVAFNPSVSLREVLLHVCIRFPVRPFLVNA